MMKFGVRVAEWLARDRGGLREAEAEGERQLSPEVEEGGWSGRAGGSAVGYTFEYINVCNSEFVLEWASAILSGGY